VSTPSIACSESNSTRFKPAMNIHNQGASFESRIREIQTRNRLHNVRLPSLPSSNGRNSPIIESIDGEYASTLAKNLGTARIASQPHLDVQTDPIQPKMRGSVSRWRGRVASRDISLKLMRN
jgi:hypothetical protein